MVRAAPPANKLATPSRQHRALRASTAPGCRSGTGPPMDGIAACRLLRGDPIGRAAVEQVAEPADPVPAVAIGLEHDDVAAAGVGLAVLVGEEVDQRARA